ncbi:MAG: type I glyceraldehyde-3-phosphate dehydrogenase [Lachnospiraceae bacterium]|nr:type I glyceraldehyde-3-phosphate dehydrogenase [Lachnospiraceae bacterium]
MAIKVGINGFGRIARVAIRIMAEYGDQFDLRGINIRNADLDFMCYSLKYDTAFGRFQGTVEKYEDGLVINGKKVKVFSEDKAENIHWDECGAEYIIESTGVYLTSELCSQHFNHGAKKVIISAPAKDDTPMFVLGVNSDTYTSDMKIISNASCTTNCLAPMAKVINDAFGIESGLMSTIHASTSKQKAVDARDKKDWRIGRSVYGNIIPSTTGAAKAVGKVIPDLKGKLTGMSYRIPACDGSVVDLTVNLKNPTTYDEIVAAMQKAADGEFKGIIEVSKDPIVSTDMLGYPVPSVFDVKGGIMLNEKFVKLLAWYDNEWGYTSMLIRMLMHMAEVDAAG